MDVILVGLTRVSTTQFACNVIRSVVLVKISKMNVLAVLELIENKITLPVLVKLNILMIQIFLTVNHAVMCVMDVVEQLVIAMPVLILLEI